MNYFFNKIATWKDFRRVLRTHLLGCGNGIILGVSQFSKSRITFYWPHCARLPPGCLYKPETVGCLYEGLRLDFTNRAQQWRHLSFEIKSASIN